MSKYRNLLEGGLGIGVTGCYLLSNGPLVEWKFKWKQWSFTDLFDTPIIRSFIGDKPVITEELRQLIEEVMQEQFGTANELPVEFKSIYSTKPSTEGSFKTFRTINGLPDYFNIFAIHDLKSNRLNGVLDRDFKIKVKDPKYWFTDNGLILIDSFSMSRNAKKFLIARQLQAANSNEILSRGALISACLALYFVSRRYFESVAKKKHTSPLLGNFILFGLILGLYTGGILTMQTRWELNSDAMAITKGLLNSKELDKIAETNEPKLIDPNYLEGAIEYYTKLKQRNISLWALARQQKSFFTFSSKFKKDGDSKSSFMNPELSLSTKFNRLTYWKTGVNMYPQRKTAIDYYFPKSDKYKNTAS